MLLYKKIDPFDFTRSLLGPCSTRCNPRPSDGRYRLWFVRFHTGIGALSIETGPISKLSGWLHYLPRGRKSAGVFGGLPASPGKSAGNNFERHLFHSHHAHRAFCLFQIDEMSRRTSANGGLPLNVVQETQTRLRHIKFDTLRLKSQIDSIVYMPMPALLKSPFPRNQKNRNVLQMGWVVGLRG